MTREPPPSVGYVLILTGLALAAVLIFLWAVGR